MEKNMFNNIKNNFFLLRVALAENDLDKITSINYELSEALTKSQFDILGNSASFDSELFNERYVYERIFYN